MKRCNFEEMYYNSYLPEGMKLPCLQDAGYDPTDPYVNHNIVKDYRTLENQQDPGQVSLRQNINSRHVRLENNSRKDVLVGINTFRDYRFRPKPQFTLRGGEARDLAVNMPGDRMQYIWLYSPITGQILNDPHQVYWNNNMFVVNEGINRWWILDMYHKGYTGQH